MRNWPETLGYRIDIFTVFSLLGIAQGIFLVGFFLSKKNDLVYRYTGFFLCCTILISLEILLCYSGVIVHIPHYVDFSEPFNFLIAPFLYLAVTAFIGKHPKHWYWHLLPFVIYLLNHQFFLFQSENFKLNAFRWAYHPELPELPNEQYFTDDFLGIKKYVNQLALMQGFIYIIPIFSYLRGYFQNQKKSFWATVNQVRFRWFFVFLCLQFLDQLLYLFKVMFVFRDALDNLSASYQSFIIYVINFFVINDAIFQNPQRSEKKYEKSSLSDAQMTTILKKLFTEMKTNQPYLKTDLSLKTLAEQISVSPHHLSQVLNSKLGKNYYEWIATYRINAAKSLLQSEDYQHYKLEEIGRLAGFSSRSGFYKAFKKTEKCTPAEFKTQYL